MEPGSCQGREADPPAPGHPDTCLRIILRRILQPLYLATRTRYTPGCCLGTAGYSRTGFPQVSLEFTQVSRLNKPLHEQQYGNVCFKATGILFLSKNTRKHEHS